MDYESRREELYGLLGKLPDRNRSISVQCLAIEQKSSYTLEKLILELNGIEAVPAFLAKPIGKNAPFPTILYNHSHGGNYHIGKEEFINGTDYMNTPPYAEELTHLGYAALCIDAWCFGERNQRTESSTFKEMLWNGQVLWGMMVYDSLRAIDYLTSCDDVDSKRIGTLGMSMGSTMAWWLSALDERIRVCVDICCLTDFQALLEQGNLDDHGVYYYVPNLPEHFTTSEINTLIAPRSHLSLAGNRDPLTPPTGLDRIDMDMSQIYSELGASEHWRLMRYDCEHQELPEMRKEIKEFLGRWL